jgi:hypothetical protein
MKKSHEIVANFLISYLLNNNLDKLTEVIAGGKYVPRGETYVLDIEEQTKEIKEDIYTSVWYLCEFLRHYEPEIFYSGVFIQSTEDGYIVKIDNHYIKCIYNHETDDLILVEPKFKHFGKIDMNWFNEQLERNFQSDISEVLQDIKNHIEPLETNQDWVEIKSTP